MDAGSPGPAFHPGAIERLQRIGGPELVRKMVNAFLESAPQLMAEAKAAERRGDRGRILEILHSLTSSAGNFGGTELARCCQEGQVAVGSGGRESIHHCVVSVDTAVGRLAHHLRAQVRGLG